MGSFMPSIFGLECVGYGEKGVDREAKGRKGWPVSQRGSFGEAFSLFAAFWRSIYLEAEVGW